MTTTMRFDRSLLRRYVRLQGWKGRDCVAPILFFLGLFCLQAALGSGVLCFGFGYLAARKKYKKD